jgi:hypothetical protein
MRCTCTIHIEAPVEKIFGLVLDPGKVKLWLDGVEEPTFAAPFDPANPIGARFKQKIREGGRVAEYDGEVTGFAPPTHLGVRIFGVRIFNWVFAVQVDYHFTPDGTGTRFDYSFGLRRSSWFFRFAGSLLLVLEEREALREALGKLKALAEAR